MANIVNMFPGGGAKVKYATGTASISAGGATSVDVTGLDFTPNLIIATESFLGRTPCRTQGPLLTAVDIAPSVFKQYSYDKQSASISAIFSGGFTISVSASGNATFTWHAFLIE